VKWQHCVVFWGSNLILTACSYPDPWVTNFGVDLWEVRICGYRDRKSQCSYRVKKSLAVWATVSLDKNWENGGVCVLILLGVHLELDICCQFLHSWPLVLHQLSLPFWQIHAGNLQDLLPSIVCSDASWNTEMLYPCPASLIYSACFLLKIQQNKWTVDRIN